MSNLRPAAEIARELVAELMRNGAGEKADRLVLTVDDSTPRDLGGWCAGAIEDRITAAIEADRQEVEAVALERASRTASLFTVNPDRSIHPDIPWEKMTEAAQMVAHTTAQQIAAELTALAASARKGGGK
jgi:hypothetical protein